MKRASRGIGILMTIAVLLGTQAAWAQAADYAGEWVCVAVDPGDGVKVTRYEGIDVKDLVDLKLQEDGTLILTSMGAAMPGTWKEENGGISVSIEGEAVPFELKDGQLVNTSDGVTMYLEKTSAKPVSGGLLSLIKGSKYTGQWVAATVDEGDGIQKKEIDGVNVRDLMSFRINRDGTLVFTTAGIDLNGTWHEIDGGIAVTVDDEKLDMLLQGDMLVVKTEGVTIHLTRPDSLPAPVTPAPPAPPAFSFAGLWNATRYEMAGYVFDIKQLFPDGCTLLLREDGTAEAFVTKDYIEKLTWTEENGALTLSGSYIFSSPVWSAEKAELSLFYGSDAVSIVFTRGQQEAPALTMAPAFQSAQAPIPTATPDATDAPVAVTEPTAAPEAIISTESEPLLCETKLFRMTLFGAGWQENRGWRSDSDDYAAVTYDKTDASGAKTASVSITASNEDVGNHRDRIKRLEQYAAKAGKEQLDSVTIGGIPFSFAEYEQWGWHYAEYAARIPASRVTLTMTVERPENIDDTLPMILNSIAFKLPVLTPPNVAPPLPEDGARYEPVTAAAAMGTAEIKAKWLKSDTPIILDSIFYNQILLSGERLYVLTGNVLGAYIVKEDKLVPDASFAGGRMTLPDKYEYLAQGEDGILYVSQGMFNILAIKDAAVFKDNALSGDLTMHPSGKWGISFWVNADPMLVKASGGELTGEPWVMSSLSDPEKRQGRFSSISCAAISDTRIYVAGTDAKEGDAQRVGVYDLSGTELFTFGNTDWMADDALGSVTGIVETANGILILDGNSRAFKLFSLEGEFLGQVECDALLGTDYPWLSAMVRGGDGVLAAAAQGRKDESGDELLIFHVSGF